MHSVSHGQSVTLKARCRPAPADAAGKEHGVLTSGNPASESPSSFQSAQLRFFPFLRGVFSLDLPETVDFDLSGYVHTEEAVFLQHMGGKLENSEYYLVCSAYVVLIKGKNTLDL